MLLCLRFSCCAGCARAAAVRPSGPSPSLASPPLPTPRPPSCTRAPALPWPRRWRVTAPLSAVLLLCRLCPCCCCPALWAITLSCFPPPPNPPTPQLYPGPRIALAPPLACDMLLCLRFSCCAGCARAAAVRPSGPSPSPASPPLPTPRPPSCTRAPALPWARRWRVTCSCVCGSPAVPVVPVLLLSGPLAHHPLLLPPRPNP